MAPVAQGSVAKKCSVWVNADGTQTVTLRPPDS